MHACAAGRSLPVLYTLLSRFFAGSGAARGGRACGKQAPMTLRDISMDENRRDLPRLPHGVE